MPMTTEAFKKLADDLFMACEETLDAKGRDYASSVEDNRLRNFEETGRILGLSLLKVIRVFLQKHLDAIDAYINTGELASEPIWTRIVDAINYLVLLQAGIESQRQEEGLCCDGSGCETC